MNDRRNRNTHAAVQSSSNSSSNANIESTWTPYAKTATNWQRLAISSDRDHWTHRKQQRKAATAKLTPFMLRKIQACVIAVAGIDCRCCCCHCLLLFPVITTAMVGVVGVVDVVVATVVDCCHCHCCC